MKMVNNDTLSTIIPSHKASNAFAKLTSDNSRNDASHSSVALNQCFKNITHQNAAA